MQEILIESLLLPEVLPDLVLSIEDLTDKVYFLNLLKNNYLCCCCLLEEMMILLCGNSQGLEA